VILDMNGAEQLLGRGDMLFMAPDAAKPIRVQGTYVSEGEVERIVNFWRTAHPPDQGTGDRGQGTEGNLRITRGNPHPPSPIPHPPR
jgi:S-DNA-T family DNA segregation ATPase FtsK/SpoIIIE